MLKLCNILTADANFKTVDFVNITNDYKTCIDNDLPTLIIGWERVKELFPNTEISILNGCIDEKTYWVFSKFENNSAHQKDVLSFYKFILTNVNNELKYVYFNILSATKGQVKRFIKFLNDEKIDKTIFLYNNNFLYITFCDKIVLGVSLSDLEFINVKPDKLLKIIKSKKNNKIYYYNVLSFDLQKIIKDNKILTTYLMSLLTQ